MIYVRLEMWAAGGDIEGRVKIPADPEKDDEVHERLSLPVASCTFMAKFTLKLKVTFSSRQMAKSYVSHPDVLPFKSPVFKQIVILSVLASTLLRVKHYNCVSFAKQL